MTTRVFSCLTRPGCWSAAGDDGPPHILNSERLEMAVRVMSKYQGLDVVLKVRGIAARAGRSLMRVSWTAAMMALFLGASGQSSVHAEGINAIGFAQHTYRNASGADADDFHAEFNFPTLAVGTDPQGVGGLLQPPDGGGGGTKLNWTLNSPIANGDNYRLTFSPGGLLFLAPNLITAYFTSNGKEVPTEGVSLWDSFFSFVPGNNESAVASNVQFYNQGSTVTLSGLTAVGIPGQFFTFADFGSDTAIAQGFPLNIPDSVTIPSGGSTSTFSLGDLPLGDYVLVTGTVSRPGDPNSFPFAFAAQPVPEPSTLTLVGIATFSLLGYAWRHRKRLAV
jgi:hypothetical protein